MEDERKLEQWYRANAKPDCPKGDRGCGGLGLLQYFYAQDDSQIAPCLVCFPDDPWAREGARDWSNHRTSVV